MNEEIWKPIKGYEDDYIVSNIGRVKSLDRICRSGKFRKGKLISINKNNKGYPIVNLWKNGFYKTSLVHRLVAFAFIPNPKNKPYVNHIDESRDNNHYLNLEWCTPKENINHGTAIKRMREIALSSTKNKKAIIQMDLDGIYIREYRSLTEASKYGYDTGQLCRVCKGINKTHKGFKWKYKGSK